MLLTVVAAPMILAFFPLSSKVKPSSPDMRLTLIHLGSTGMKEWWSLQPEMGIAD